MPPSLKSGLYLAAVAAILMFGVVFTHHRPEAIVAMILSIVSMVLIVHGMWLIWKARG